MDPPEGGIGEWVLAPTLLPAVDNALIISMSHGWCAGLV